MQGVSIPSHGWSSTCGKVAGGASRNQAPPIPQGARTRRFAPLRVSLVFAPMLPAPPAGAAVQAVSHRPLIVVGANKSNNWSGYNQGTLEQGGKLFNEVAGDWTVPTATA